MISFEYDHWDVKYFRTRTRQFSVPRTPASTSSGRDARSDELRQLDVVRNIWNWVGGAGGATPVRTSPSDALVPVVMPKPTTTRQWVTFESGMLSDFTLEQRYVGIQLLLT